MFTCFIVHMIIQLIWMSQIDTRQATMNKQIEKLTPPADTVYINAVQIRYGTRDTVFQMYPIDSAKVAAEYINKK